MEPQNDRTPPEQPQASQPPPPKKRFQLVKLEERITPGKGGGTNTPHTCATSSASSGESSNSGPTSIF